MLRVFLVSALLLVASAKLPSKSQPLLLAKSGAPGAAPGAAPGGAPGGAPAAPAPKDKFGADTHAEEFGNEYLVHEHKTVKEPNALEDKAWKNEMHTKLE